MAVQVAGTSLLSLLMAAALMMGGLPPIAYTIPDRLAVFSGKGPVFGLRPGGPLDGITTMAGLLPR